LFGFQKFGGIWQKLGKVYLKRLKELSFLLKKEVESKKCFKDRISIIERGGRMVLTLLV